MNAKIYGYYNGIMITWDKIDAAAQYQVTLSYKENSDSDKRFLTTKIVDRDECYLTISGIVADYVNENNFRVQLKYTANIKAIDRKGDVLKECSISGCPNAKMTIYDPLGRVGPC